MSSEETTQVDWGMSDYWCVGMLVIGLSAFVVLIGSEIVSAVVQYPYASVESVGAILVIIVVPYAVGRLSFWLWGLIR